MIISALWADKDEVQLALMQQVIAILCAELKRTAAGSRRKRHSGRSGLKGGADQRKPESLPRAAIFRADSGNEANAIFRIEGLSFSARYAK
jgi:hypothetical protein